MSREGAAARSGRQPSGSDCFVDARRRGTRALHAAVSVLLFRALVAVVRIAFDGTPRAMDDDSTGPPSDHGTIQHYLAGFAKDVGGVTDEDSSGARQATSSVQSSSGGIGKGGGAVAATAAFDPSMLGGPSTQFVIQTLAGPDGQPYLTQNVDGRFFQAAFFSGTDSIVTSSVVGAPAVSSSAYGSDKSTAGLCGFPASSASSTSSICTVGRQYLTASTATDGGIVFTAADGSPLASSASPLALSMSLGGQSGTDGHDTIVIRSASGSGDQTDRAGGSRLQEQQLCVSIGSPNCSIVQCGMIDKQAAAATAAKSSGPIFIANGTQFRRPSSSSCEQQAQQEREMTAGSPSSILSPAGQQRLLLRSQQKAAPVAGRATGSEKLIRAAVSAEGPTSTPLALIGQADSNSQLAVTIVPPSQQPPNDEGVSYVLIVAQPPDAIGPGSGSGREAIGGADLSVFSFKDDHIPSDSQQPVATDSSSGSVGVLGKQRGVARQEDDVDDGGCDEDDDDVDDEYDDDEGDAHAGLLGTESNSCSYCAYSSPKRYLLSRHMKTHSEDRPHKCSVCDRAFKTQASLTNHTNTHTGTRPHKCKDCESAFTTSGELVRHMRYRHTFERPHRCTHPGCEYSSVELSKLKRHVRSHTGERPYQCPHCTYASPDTYKLKRHLRIHTGEKPYACDICSARFTQSNSLKAHKLIHSGTKPVFQCELCPTTCGRRTDLKIHQQKLHTSDRPLQCKKCSKYFPDRYTYKLHLKSHDGEKCFKCGLCAYAALSERHLQSHIVTQHNQEKPYECTECTEAFRRRPLLRRHRIFVHGAEDFRPKDKLFGCGECGKAFVLADNFHRHQLYHDPEAECYNNDEFLAELEAVDEIGETFDDEDEAAVDSSDAADSLSASSLPQQASETASRQLLLQAGMQADSMLMRRYVSDVNGHRVVVTEVGPPAGGVLLTASTDGTEPKQVAATPAGLAVVQAAGAEPSLTAGSCGPSLTYPSLSRLGVTGSASAELLSDHASVQLLYNMVNSHGEQQVAQGRGIGGHLVVMHGLDGDRPPDDASTVGCGSLTGRSSSAAAAFGDGRPTVMVSGLSADAVRPLAGDRDCSQLLFLGGSTGDDASAGTDGSSCLDLAPDRAAVSNRLMTVTLDSEPSALSPLGSVTGKHSADQTATSRHRAAAFDDDNRLCKRAKLDECFFDDDAL